MVVWAPPAGHNQDATEIMDTRGTRIKEIAGTGIVCARGGASRRTARAGSGPESILKRPSSKGPRHQHSSPSTRSSRHYLAQKDNRDRERTSRYRARSRGSIHCRGTRDQRSRCHRGSDRSMEEGKFAPLVPGLGCRDLDEITCPIPCRKSVILALESVLHPFVLSRILRRTNTHT